MFGLMQDCPLLISSILTFAARHHPEQEVVSNTVEGGIHRYTYAAMERRCRRLARVLQRLGVGEGDRVGTLAWNGYRHMELYYAVPGMGAICHTVNPRLFPDQIAYILNHAEDRVLFVETGFVPLLEGLAPKLAGSLRAVVVLTDAGRMPEVRLPPGLALHCYEDLLAVADEDFVWREFDERTASALCYTSGTTGNPKGVLYSHRSTVLHAWAVNMPDVLGFRAVDRAMPVVPMFHANAWGMPYAVPMAGGALVLPGPHMDPASLRNLIRGERVSFAAGVPTIWFGLLHHLRANGGDLAPLKRMIVGGSACPTVLIDGFADFGVGVEAGWGMTETSPVAGYNRPTPGTLALEGEEAARQAVKQGRALFGIDVKIVNGEGREQPRDGRSVGDILLKGPWTLSAYYQPDAVEPAGSLDPDGWFRSGDIGSLDRFGFLEITDRAKDIIKSGGEWISSILLENIAVTHPGVAEAAVIAARHPRWEERPLLIVVPKAGHGLDPSDLLAFFQGKVARWWIPDDVVIVPDLPHTATGKLQKTALRERFAGHLTEKPAT